MHTGQLGALLVNEPFRGVSRMGCVAITTRPRRCLIRGQDLAKWEV